MLYYGLKMDVAKFATALQLHFGKDLDLARITRVGKSDICTVEIVTDTSSVAIVEKEAVTYSLRPTNIWLRNTPATASRRR